MTESITTKKKKSVDRKSPIDFFYDHPILSVFLIMVFPPIVLLAAIPWIIKQLEELDD